MTSETPRFDREVERCDHDDLLFLTVDIDGLPEALWADYHCDQCGGKVSVRFERTDEAVAIDLDTGESYEVSVR